MDIKSIDFLFIFNSIEYFLSNQRNFSKKQFISFLVIPNLLFYSIRTKL